MIRLSTVIILVGIVRGTPLPPPLGIVLGLGLVFVGVVLRLFTER